MRDINIAAALENIYKTGFLDIEVDASMDLFFEIERLKKEKKSE